MSNSKLISCTLISPNKNSPRNHKIDTITIHCVVGQCSAERIGEIFKLTSRQASSNYGIGYDGRIGLYVDEADRSWCSSSAANDNRAITIEVASDTKHPYAVNDKAYAALLDLVEDICRRNGIKKLVWSTSKDDRVNHKNGCNMTVHRDYANKACPGDYLYNRHGEIAAEVNRRLGVPAVEQKPEQKPQGDAKNLYRVQLGAFEKKDNATAFAAKLKKEGFDTYIVQIGKYYKVQVGAFGVKKNAEAMLEKLKKAGHDDAFITYSGTSGGTSERKITTGSKVRVKAGAKTYSGGSLASFVYSRDHIVKELSGKRAVVVGRSLVVGKPAAMMLDRENATVTLCNSRTQNLPEVCRQADIVVVAMGKMAAVGADCLRAGQTVVDVGIHVNEEGKLCGDVQFAAAEPVVDAITPVPGGVGTVTTSVLVGHVVQAACKKAGVEC